MYHKFDKLEKQGEVVFSNNEIITEEEGTDSNLYHYDIGNKCVKVTIKNVSTLPEFIDEVNALPFEETTDQTDWDYVHNLSEADINRLIFAEKLEELLEE